ncbi:uncharacterized protein TNCV_3560931 [Trichonephila clavipes]|nr:uncharacterized protein TNCV_3560931 [Trichonephila clavipes]
MLEKVIENWTSRSDYIRASRGSPMPEIIFEIGVALCITVHGGPKTYRVDIVLTLSDENQLKESVRLTASRVARDKPWSTLCKKSHGIPSSPRAAAVAKFRLLTGHDCLCAHLFRFNLVTSPICVLCDTGQDMTAAHLDECSALNDLNCIVKRLHAGRRGWFVVGLVRPRVRVRPRHKSVDFHDAEYRQRPCCMVMRHVKDP